MAMMGASRERARSAALTVGALVVVAAFSAVLVWAMSTMPYNTWGGVLFAPVLLLGSIPLLRRAARDEDTVFFWILFVALLLKLLSSLARYGVAESLYDGSADAAVYAKEGARLAEAYRQGIFTADIGRGFIGTGALRVITGILFAITGVTQLGGYMIFSWIAYWGLVAFYKAFKIGVPEGVHRRYAWLVLFLPSMLYWPSSIGKDAWMLLGLGCASLGAARLLTRRSGAVPPLVVGLVATVIVRPHVSALLCAGLVGAYVLRRDSRSDPYLGPLAKPLGVLVLCVIMAVVVQQAQGYFKVDDQAATDGAETVLDEAADRTDTGGSDFEAVNARSITDVPAAIVAVMFRPFPWEVHNGQALLASLEGLAILFMLLRSVRRLSGIGRLARRSPYVVLVVVYSLLFCVAFSSFGNFGIITRQRVQLLPFALTLLALPAATPRQRTIRLSEQDLLDDTFTPASA